MTAGAVVPILPTPADPAAAADPAVAAAAAPKPPRESTADRLIRHFEDHYMAWTTPEGRVVGAALDQPGRALVHGTSDSPFMRLVQAGYRAQHGSYPDTGAAATASAFVRNTAADAPKRPAPLRCQGAPDRLLVDVGDPGWSVIEITADGWRWHAQAPEGIAFRRSEVTGSLPVPADRGDLEVLWTLLPVHPLDQPVLLAVLLTTWITTADQPVLAWTGPQGVGKTTGARLAASLVDPVTIDVGGSLPNREDQWKARLSPYRIVVVDNVSAITAAQSDMLCMVATGGEAATRAHYTNDDLHITTLRVPVWLTSIGIGATRGDLAGRMVRLELTRFADGDRRALSDLRAAQDAARPAILRGLLDLAVQVLRVMPDVDQRPTHRLGDLERVVRAVDRVLGTQGATRLRTQADDLAEDVLGSVPVAQAVKAAVKDGVAGWKTAGDWMIVLRRYADRLGHTASGSWPTTPQIMSEQLQRISDDVATAWGFTISPRKRTKDGAYTFIGKADAYVDFGDRT